MSRNGIPALKELHFFFSRIGASSAGVRSFFIVMFFLFHFHFFYSAAFCDSPSRIASVFWTAFLSLPTHETGTLCPTNCRNGRKNTRMFLLPLQPSGISIRMLEVFSVLITSHPLLCSFFFHLCWVFAPIMSALFRLLILSLLSLVYPPSFKSKRQTPPVDLASEVFFYEYKSCIYFSLLYFVWMECEWELRLLTMESRNNTCEETERVVERLRRQHGSGKRDRTQRFLFFLLKSGLIHSHLLFFFHSDSLIRTTTARRKYSSVPSIQGFWNPLLPLDNHHQVHLTSILFIKSIFNPKILFLFPGRWQGEWT